MNSRASYRALQVAGSILVLASLGTRSLAPIYILMVVNGLFTALGLRGFRR